MDPEYDAYIDAALSLNNLILTPDVRLEVAKQFALLAGMKATLEHEPIPADEEPANIYRL